MPTIDLESGSPLLDEAGNPIYEEGTVVPFLTESFDGVTAPATPANWNVGGPATYATTTGENSISPYSSPNMLKASLPTGTVLSFFTYGAATDGNGGNLAVTARTYGYSSIGRVRYVGVALRGSSSTLDNTSTSCYVGWYSPFDAYAGISKIVNGVETVLQQVTVGATSATWVDVTLQASGSTLTLTCHDPASGDYLNASGVWAATSANAATATDSSLTGAGYLGLYAKTPGNAFTAYWDDVTATAVAAPASGTVSVTLGALTAAGSGSFTASGSASVALGPLAGSGTGAFTATASAAPSLAGLAAAGTGTFKATASASPTLAGLTATAAGTFRAAASAAPTLGPLAAAGTGTVLATATAAGSVTLAGLAASAAGTTAIAGSASPTLGPLATAAAGTFAADSSAAVALGSLAAAGVAFSGAFASAAPTLGPLTAAGSGTSSNVASGSVTLAGLAGSASGSFATAASSTPTLGPLVAAGQSAGATVASASVSLAGLMAAGGSSPVTYRVYMSPSADQPIDYDAPVAATDALSWTSGTLSPGTWRFGVRASNANGEELNLACSTAVIVAADGSDVTARPDAPTGLRAHAAAGGAIVVAWSYASTATARKPTGFHVYTGTAGTPDYTAAAKTVAYGSTIAGAYQVTLTGLADATAYTIGVRAYNAAGGEEPNTATVQATADATGPAAVTSLAGSAVV